MGQGAFTNPFALAEGFPQEDGRRGVTIGDGLNVHGYILPTKVNHKPTYYMGTYSIYKFFLTLSLSAHYGQISVFFGRNFSLKTRRIEIAGATPHPNSQWMQQVGRNLTDCADGFLRISTHVILDRDNKHLPLRQILKSSDIEVVVLPHKSPNLNAHLERFMRSLNPSVWIV